MIERVRFLLVHSAADPYWPGIAEAALAPFGDVERCLGADALDALCAARYDVAIIDASGVDELPELVARMRARQPRARIVIMTASPTWKRAREAFHAGATDYLGKSLDPEEIRTQIAESMTRRPAAS